MNGKLKQLIAPINLHQPSRNECFAINRRGLKLGKPGLWSSKSGENFELAQSSACRTHDSGEALLALHKFENRSVSIIDDIQISRVVATERTDRAARG